MNEKFKIFLTSGLIGLIRKKQLTPEEEKRGLKRALIIWGIIGILFLSILFAGYLYFVRSPSVKCADVGCFIAKANQCEPATYEETTNIGKINYSVKSGANNGCVLIKQVAELNQNENSFLKKVLEKKQMECVYSKGKFNGQWLISMIEGLEDCKGELKDAIGQLLILI